MYIGITSWCGWEFFTRPWFFGVFFFCFCYFCSVSCICYSSYTIFILANWPNSAMYRWTPNPKMTGQTDFSFWYLFQRNHYRNATFVCLFVCHWKSDWCPVQQVLVETRILNKGKCHLRFNGLTSERKVRACEIVPDYKDIHAYIHM